MKIAKQAVILFFISSCILISCNGGGSGTAKDSTSAVPAQDTSAASSAPSIKTEDVSYMADTLPALGYIAYDANRKGRRPIVLIVHEWWGLTDYTKTRANQLAAMGYFAVDVDMYGHGDTASTPPDALSRAGLYYRDPALAKSRLEAALAKAVTYPEADSSKVAAIGYCFGGFIVLNAAKLGSPLKGVVSFHGDLSGAAPEKGLITADVLVCQGGSDKLVPPVAQAAFKKSMDSVGAHYTFKTYPGAMHAFTNPASTANGQKFKMPIAYNAAADSASWKDMKDFFAVIFK